MERASLRRAEDVRDLDFDAGHRLPHIEKFLRFPQIDIGQGRIVLVHAGLKDADQREGAGSSAPCLGPDRTGRGRHHIDRIADEDAQPHRQFFSQDDAGLFCLDWPGRSDHLPDGSFTLTGRDKVG